MTDSLLKEWISSAPISKLIPRSFYDIHGGIPEAGEELPKDGVMVFIREDNKQAVPCDCWECNYQRKYRKELRDLEELIKSTVKSFCK